MNLRRAVFFVFVGTAIALPQSQPLLQITSPKTGTIVSPGQTVIVSVAADPSVSNIYVLSSLPGPGLAEGPDASGKFSLTIPAKTPIGRYKVTAFSPSSRPHDLEESQPIFLAVENPLPVVKLEPQSVSLQLDGPGVELPINVIATFSDGSQGNVSRSINTKYKSLDTTVATVTDEGQVKGQAPGSTAIIVTVGSLQVAVIVAVDQPRPPSTSNIVPPRKAVVTKGRQP